MPTKTRVTLTLDPKVVAAVDRYAKQGAGPSRSRAIENILREWQAAQRKIHLVRETEAYYGGRNRSEIQEDQEWAEGAVRAARTVWEEE